MKTYRPKNLIPYYKLGYEKGNYIAVPSKYEGCGVLAKFNAEEMVINWKREIEKRAFVDKFNGGAYCLSYFEWKPTQAKLL